MKVHKSKKIIKILDKQSKMSYEEEDKLYDDLSKWFYELQQKVQMIIYVYYDNELFLFHINKIRTTIEDMKQEYYDILLNHSLTQFYNAREITTKLCTIQQNKVNNKSGFQEPQLKRQEYVGLFQTYPQIEYILRYNTSLATDIKLKGVEEKITDILAMSYREGLGIDDASRRINKEFKQLKDWQSRRIARTEINSAQNEGAFSAYDELGVEYHMWWTGKDARVRDSHYALHGHIVAVGNTFSNGLLYPGDKTGPIKEWINCRCTSIPYIMPLGKMAPQDLTEFTENQLEDIFKNGSVWGSDSNDFRLAKITPEPPSYLKYYKAPKDAKPIVIDEAILKKELNGIVEEKDIPTFLELFEKFNDTTLDCNYEWSIGVTNKGFSPQKARTDWSRIWVNLHPTLINLKPPEKLLISVHNHIWGMNILPSDKDLVLYCFNEVKYGIITNEMGMFIFRNNNKNILSSETMDYLLDDLADIEKDILKRFQNDKNITFDKNNDNHRYLLNEYVKDNIDFWADKYSSFLFEYNMEIKFINAKKYSKSR